MDLYIPMTLDDTPSTVPSGFYYSRQRRFGVSSDSQMGTY